MTIQKILRSSLLFWCGIFAICSLTACQNTPSHTDHGESSALWNMSVDAVFGRDRMDNLLEVGQYDPDEGVFTFIRFSPDAIFFADEVTHAELHMRTSGYVIPKTLQIALVTGAWDDYFTSYDDARALIGERVRVDVTNDGDGWITIPLTDFVKKWLASDVANNGIAIFSADNGTYRFISSTDSDNVPYITLTGVIGDRPLIYGKFGYTETPLSGATNMGGNCLSYALRDVNMILGEDLQLKSSDLKMAYESGGVDAIAEYIAPYVIKYVNSYSGGLQISNFRRIDHSDSPIDHEREYRIAMRVGVDPYAEGTPDFSEEKAYDYHFWLELDDGHWAQKYPTGHSLIVPTSAHNIDPGKYPWDAGYEWTLKSRNYYTSKTIYFAVTKDTDAITEHRGETMDRDENASSEVLSDDAAKKLVADMISQAVLFTADIYNVPDYFHTNESITIPGTRERNDGHPYVLVVDDHIKTLDDLRDATLAVFSYDVADEVFFQRFLQDTDLPIDALDYTHHHIPLYYEYEGRLYVNTNAGGNGFPYEYPSDTIEITKLTDQEITARVKRTLFGESDGEIEIHLEQSMGEWLIMNDFMHED